MFYFVVDATNGEDTMKASEVISVLQKIIETEGDIEVIIPNQECGGDESINKICTRKEEILNHQTCYVEYGDKCVISFDHDNYVFPHEIKYNE